MKTILTIIISFSIGIPIILLMAYFFYKKDKKDVVSAQRVLQQINQEIEQKKQQLGLLENEKQKTIEANTKASNSLTETLNSLSLSQEEYTRIVELLSTAKIDNQKFQDSLLSANREYIKLLEQTQEKTEQEFDMKKQECEKSLESLRNSLSAGMQAQLREKEKIEKIDFYKIVLTDEALADIEMLNKLKTNLHQPIIINKLIWSTFCQKKVTEMCNRVLGNSVKIGIYKITNLLTQQCYVGQSVNVAERWKQHCKCGCGIEASSTNRLYQDMIKNGIWNFSFELIEECSREELNEKEKFWINMYQSDIYGLNSTKGNK